jgi:hypothetical protein
MERRRDTTAGLVSALVHMALGSFQCNHCGTIRLSELPVDARNHVIRSSVLLILGAFAVIVLTILVFVFEHFL